jgi:glycosyltransferase involved in cell wall biosynthesis
MFIEDTILSVKDQTYKNIEHIVIDGGSTDNTLDILKKNTSSILWISEPDQGQTNAINKGIKLSRGEIIAYLNSDDLYLPDTIRIVTDFFIAHPEIDMIYGNIEHIDKEGRFIQSVRPGKIILENYLTGEVYLPQPSVFFRKRIVKKIGYFDESLHLAMDMDYWTTIMLNFPSEYLQVTLAKARIYPEAKSSSQHIKYIEEKKYILDKVFSNESLLISRFGSIERVREVKKKAYSFVYFFGGMEYLRDRQIIPAFEYLINGIKLFPMHLLDSYLYWSIFVAIVGKTIANKVKIVLPNKIRIRKW